MFWLQVKWKLRWCDFHLGNCFRKPKAFSTSTLIYNVWLTDWMTSHIKYNNWKFQLARSEKSPTFTCILSLRTRLSDVGSERQWNKSTLVMSCGEQTPPSAPRLCQAALFWLHLDLWKTQLGISFSGKLTPSSFAENIGLNNAGFQSLFVF